jgi:hypothetical protein
MWRARDVATGMVGKEVGLGANFVLLWFVLAPELEGGGRRV